MTKEQATRNLIQAMRDAKKLGVTIVCDTHETGNVVPLTEATLTRTNEGNDVILLTWPKTWDEMTIPCPE